MNLDLGFSQCSTLRLIASASHNDVNGTVITIMLLTSVLPVFMLAMLVALSPLVMQMIIA